MATEVLIPEAIKKQAKEAEELHRKMYPEQYGDTLPVVNKPEENQQQGTPSTEDKGTPPKEAPDKTIETAPEVAETTEPEATEKEPETVITPVEGEGDQYTKLYTAYQKILKTHEIMKNKYELGKHNEEYRSALEARDNRIANLETEIVNLKGSRDVITSTPASVPAIEVTPELQTVFDDIKADVGEDTANKLAKYFNLVAVQAAQKMVTPFGQEIDTVRQEINSVRTNTQRRLGEDYVVILTELCPDWQVIKNDPGFIDYLNEYDIGSGKTRFDLAREGAESLDAERVAHWYNGYKHEIGLLTETPVKTTAKSNPPKKGKEALIAPTSSPKGTVKEPEKTYYTQDQLKDISHRITNLNMAGRIEEATRLAKDRDSAIAERRILP